MTMYIESWKQEVESKPKLENYRYIKPEWGVPPHLKVTLPKNKRSIVTQLRLGCLGLEIELGRYHGIPRAGRICKLCQTEPESELHFLFQCSKLADAHEKLYQKLPWLTNIIEPIKKFELLCNSPYTFANYCNELWVTRNNRLKV